MEYRLLGRTGMTVSSLCLGTLTFGPRGNADPDDCKRLVHAALDAGITAFDTADVYTAGRAEEILGDALRGCRDNVVIVTKGRGRMGPDPNARGLSRRWLTTALDASLKRLKTDWVDLY